MVTSGSGDRARSSRGESGRGQKRVGAGRRSGKAPGKRDGSAVRKSSGGADGGRTPRGSSRRSAADPDNSSRRGGSRLTPRKPRLPEPRIPEGVTGRELDRGVHQQLRTLSKENAEGVAQHLVMAAALMEADDLEGALAHAETAVRRAGRVAAAREALGLVCYRMGDFAAALREFRTVKRISGSNHLIALMVDCERGLGRVDRALDLAASAETGRLAIEDRVELAIVVSGIRRDLGQLDAAEVALRIPAAKLARHQQWAARLHYALADVRLAAGDTEGARELFSRAVATDELALTDASERLAQLDGIVLTEEFDETPAESSPTDAASEPGS